MLEVLLYYKPKIDASGILKKLKLERQNYFVVSAHREENVDSEKQFQKLVHVLNQLSKEYRKRIVMTTHPRTRKRIEASEIKLESHIDMCKPFGFGDYVQLQKNAIAVLSDSGTITEESSILNFPALNIRNAHERPEGMEEGTVMLVGLDWVRIQEGLCILKNQPRDKDRLLAIVDDYNAPNVSEKILRIIISYTDYINRVVWKS